MIVLDSSCIELLDGMKFIAWIIVDQKLFQLEYIFSILYYER
jgi:hypothetical protein